MEICGSFKDKCHDIKADVSKFIWLSLAYCDLDVSSNAACVIFQNMKPVVLAKTLPHTQKS
jgi:hypothetical protein